MAGLINCIFFNNQRMTMTKTALGISNVRLPNVRKEACITLLFFFSLFITVELSAKEWKGTKKINAPFADTTVRGRVVDSVNVPLVGVSVFVKGTQNGTFTNTNGEFTLRNVPTNATLVISNIGYQPVEVKLSPRQIDVAVTLMREAGTLSDVVVTGFQTIQKSKFTGAAVKLSADQVRTEGIADISRMLEGRAAGVSIQNVSGTFGAAPKVRIRGATSITGENKPLWVIDGVVLEDIVNISNDQLSSGDPNTLLGSAVAGLNPSDIESYDILKDAAATALYGARAMNGVIVITTKKGKAGKPVVSYTGNFSTQLKPSYENYDIMNSADQMSVYAEIERKGYLRYSDLAIAPNTGVYGKLAEKINTFDPATGKFEVENTPEARNAFLMRYAKENTNWFDVLFRNSLTQEHSLSVSSGTDKAQSYFSASFYNDNGWTVADNVKRYTANLRNNYAFSDRFSVGFILTGAVRQQRAPGTISRISNPVEGSFDREFDINPFSYALNTSRALTAYDENGNREFFRRNYAPFNILTELENNYIKLNLLDAKLQGQAAYKINSHLTYEFVGALRFVKTSKEHQITENSNQANAYRAAYNSTIKERNKYLYRDPDNPNAEPVVVLPYGGFYNRTEDQLTNYTFRNSLSFNQTFNEDHQITALVGQELKSADRQNSNNTGLGYQYNNGGIPFVDYRIVKQLIENNFQYYGMSNEYDRFVGFFANASYTYQGKYNLTGTVREDGSNRLGKSPSARWLPTWTVSGRWNIDRERFMEDLSSITYLTLRGSYGLNASYGSATNSTVVLRTQLTNRPYRTDRQVAIDIENLENAELTWEKKYEANVGVDIGLFNNRLNLTVDAYNRNSFDLISLIKTGGIGGEVYKAANYADLESKGLEVTLGGKPFSKKDWSWSSQLTFGYNTNTVSNAKNNPLIFDLVRSEGGAKEGYPVRGLFSLQFKGLDPWNGIALFGDEKGVSSHAVNLQSDSTQYLKYEGSIDPTITGGFSNTFNYKNFTANFLITYQAGNKIRLTPAYRGSYSDLDALPGEFKNRWTLPGDEELTIVPSIADLYANFDLGSAGAYPYNNYNYSSARVVDGSFARLKTASVSYRLSDRTLKAIGLNSVSVSVIGNNLWVIYSDPALHGQDPEFFNAGGVALPINKQFVLSLKVGF
jgi:TonB-linked SusC/RagA family outer membrane protein